MAYFPKYSKKQMKAVSDALFRAATADKPDISAIKFIMERDDNTDNRIDDILTLLTREAEEREGNNE